MSTTKWNERSNLVSLFCLVVVVLVLCVSIVIVRGVRKTQDGGELFLTTDVLDFVMHDACVGFERAPSATKSRRARRSDCNQQSVLVQYCTSTVLYSTVLQYSTVVQLDRRPDRSWDSGTDRGGATSCGMGMAMASF